MEYRVHVGKQEAGSRKHEARGCCSLSLFTVHDGINNDEIIICTAAQFGAVVVRWVGGKNGELSSVSPQ